MEHDGFVVRPVGRVEAPRPQDHGAPAAWVVFDERVRAALAGLRAGDVVVLLSWLHRADRDVLAGVFSTRAPDRPNPIGLHRATVTAVDGLRVRFDRLEPGPGTPILDVQPASGALDER